MDGEEFRSRLVRAFPPRAFFGLVSTHDECDDGIALRRELPGKRWDEISAAFIEDNCVSLPLLEPDAVVAFLPAWMLRAAETFGRDSLLLEFVVYFLSPGSPDEGWDEEGLAKMVALFDAEQRKAVGDFLRAVLEVDDDRRGFDLFHLYAKHAVGAWDR